MSSATGRPSALRRCVGEEAEFLTQHWGKCPVVRREAETGEDFTDLLDLPDVDHLVTSAGLRTPTFRLVKDGSPLPPSAYTMTPRISGVPLSGLADPARILAAIDDGATLVLQGLHRYWEPLRRLCRGLESALGHPCQVNAYFTPPGARGLAVHSDPHDVFVLQAFGSKRWEVHAPDGVWDLELTPGDALYMPKGTPHAATAQDALSGHLTVGVQTSSWRETLAAMITDVLADEAYDERLPAGWHRDPDAFSAELGSRLDDLRARLDKTDPREHAVRRAERFLTRRPPALAGGLVDRVRLGRLDDDTVVRRRPAAMCQVRAEGDQLVLLLGDRKVQMPAWLAPAVDRLAAGPAVRVRDLPQDPQSRLVLVRRLIREGLLEVAE